MGVFWGCTLPACDFGAHNTSALWIGDFPRPDGSRVSDWVRPGYVRRWEASGTQMACGLAKTWASEGARKGVSWGSPMNGAVGTRMRWRCCFPQWRASAGGGGVARLASGGTAACPRGRVFAVPAFGAYATPPMCTGVFSARDGSGALDWVWVWYARRWEASRTQMARGACAGPFVVHTVVCMLPLSKHSWSTLHSASVPIGPRPRWERWCRAWTCVVLGWI